MGTKEKGLEAVLREKDFLSNETGSLEDHKEIILEALYDYRKWWGFNGPEDETDREKRARIDAAISFIEGGGSFQAGGDINNGSREVKLHCPLKNEKTICRQDVDGRLCEAVWDCRNKANRQL